MREIDWEILLIHLDYHAKAWYENDGDIWFKITRMRAMQVIGELGFNPNEVMKQFSYRDHESHARDNKRRMSPAQDYWF